MNGYQWEKYSKSFDARRNIVIPGDANTTVRFCVNHFLRIANDSIDHHGYFAVALSGGSTPKAIFQALKKHSEEIDWNRVMVFWSDERAVPPDHSESNYKMAMDAGFASFNIPAQQIFRMRGEGDIEANALEYEILIKKFIPDGTFDLVMLGMGEDGHTASLFPKTHGLHSGKRLVIANYIPQKNSWRMTLTFDCINRARNIAIYVMGKQKAERVYSVLSSPYDPDLYPIQAIGTKTNKALWIVDNDAFSTMELSQSQNPKKS